MNFCGIAFMGLSAQDMAAISLGLYGEDEQYTDAEGHKDMDLTETLDLSLKVLSDWRVDAVTVAFILPGPPCATSAPSIGAAPPRAAMRGTAARAVPEGRGSRARSRRNSRGGEPARSGPSRAMRARS